MTAPVARWSSRLSRPKRSTVIVLACLLAITAGIGVFLYRNLERYETSTNTGPSLKAIMNPWLAAQNFLQRYQVESHRSHDLQSILDRLKPDETLILFNDTALYNTTSQKRLEDWMQSGGHLIITANYEWDEEENSSGDPFLDRYGVRMKWIEDDTEKDAAEDPDAAAQDTADDAADDSEHDAEDKPATAADADTHAQAGDKADESEDDSNSACEIPGSMEPFKVKLEGVPQPVLINFGYYYTLEDASGKAVGQADHWPNSLLQYQVGKGMMTVLLDTDIWDNRHIGDFDHAYLLWYLAATSPNVWLVVNDDSDNLIALLWRNAQYLLIGLAGMLLVWGWRRWVRFGPLIPDPTPDRRQLLEHIQAEATFSWQYQQLEPLLKSVREQIWQRLSQQHGIHNHAPDQHAIALQKLAEISQQNPEQVRLAMTCPVPAKELHWIELISLLQTIRNAL